MDVSGDGDRSEEGIGAPGRKYNHVGLWRWVKTSPRDGLRIIFLRPTESSAMGKSSARKARERKLAMEYASTPVTDKASSKAKEKRSAARADDFSMPKHPLISDAAKGGAVNQPPSATFEEGLAEPAREELIAALRVSVTSSTTYFKQGPLQSQCSPSALSTSTLLLR
jgi:hypothetical protein